MLRSPQEATEVWSFGALVGPITGEAVTIRKPRFAGQPGGIKYAGF